MKQLCITQWQSCWRRSRTTNGDVIVLWRVCYAVWYQLSGPAGITWRHRVNHVSSSNGWRYVLPAVRCSLADTDPSLRRHWCQWAMDQFFGWLDGTGQLIRSPRRNQHDNPLQIGCINLRRTPPPHSHIPAMVVDVKIQNGSKSTNSSDDTVVCVCLDWNNFSCLLQWTRVKTSLISRRSYSKGVSNSASKWQRV